MAEKITMEKLHRVVALLNKITGNPVEPWITTADGKRVSQPGCYMISMGYGRPELVQITNTNGGENQILERATKREMFDQIHAYLRGYEAGEKGKPIRENPRVVAVRKKKPRFTLTRYGSSKFEVIDNDAKPVARHYEVLSDMTLKDAEKYVATLNKGKHMLKNPRKKSRKPPSKKQLAARKKFAAMARARAKSSKKKRTVKRAPKRTTRKVRIVAHNPTRKLYIVSVVRGGQRKTAPAYWEGRAWDTNRRKAFNFPTEARATSFAQRFANKYPTQQFRVETK